ncbi:MAG: nickel-dependent hydrogenase large subunit [Candidatus Thermoplasmatota archaeon]|nr:nickel-dependent hydrogenase large subunit [Candidatus Thermoplasmatota archaeon]
MVKSTITFGPQHPVFPEPIQFILKVVDEKVVLAEPQIGYVHRGIEKAFELNDPKDNIFLAERICGICPAPHTTAYVRGVESLMGIEAPPRAKYIRTIMNELNRIHSHILWAGLLGDAIGFESYFMQTWNYREKVLDAIEKISGHRVTYAMNAIGGVRRDMTNEQLRGLEKTMDYVESSLENIEDVMKDYTIKKRTQGIGILTEEEARRDGAVGPTARASGISQDLRTSGYDAYGDLKFEPVVVNNCDSYGRFAVRWQELKQSIDLIRQCIVKMPSGEILTKSNNPMNGEAISRVEAPRGELFYYIKGNGSKKLERVKVRTPTFANIIPTVTMLSKGCQVADVSVIVLSMDPCISCTER